MMSRTAWGGVRVRAGLQPADGYDLVPGPNLDGEGLGAAAQNGLAAVVGLLQGLNDTAAVHPDKGGAEQVPRELLWQLVARGLLARQRKNRSI